MALLTKVPGMTIFAPSSYEEVRVMLDEALRTANGPVALRWSKTPARHVDAGGTGSGRNARKIQEGEDVCFLAVGKMVAAAEEAAALLLARGVHATIYDVRVLPPDPRMIADARRHPLVVTVEDGIAEGGAGALLALAIADEDVGKPGPPVVVLGTPNAFLAQAKPVDILANLGLDGPGISATVLKALDLPAAE
jgi:1-deoxy-D-xylulose-5-phosphate synthase